MWNTLPLPKVTDSVRQAVIAAGQKIIIARARHPDRSLEDAYIPDAMDPKLVAAHHALDRVVDKAFDARRALCSEVDRQRVLFQRFEQMTTAGQLSTK